MSFQLDDEKFGVSDENRPHTYGSHNPMLYIKLQTQFQYWDSNPNSSESKSDVLASYTILKVGVVGIEPTPLQGRSFTDFPTKPIGSSLR